MPFYNPQDSEKAVALAAQQWLGYGSWDADYWFIGPEPGMNKGERNNLVQRCRAWLALGRDQRPALLDCRLHHDEFKRMEWFNRTIRMRRPINGETMRPPLQSTWRCLILLLLSFKGGRNDNDAIGDYQSGAWGSERGETCVLELSALASNRLSNDTELKKKYSHFLSDRVLAIRQRVLSGHPTFVVMYGSAEPAWRYIASGQSSEQCFQSKVMAGLEAGVCINDGIAFVTALHPMAHGVTKAYWATIGEYLKNRF